MQIGVIGTGHVGLITCVTLAHIGHDVVGFDSDEDKVTSLRAGRAPFYEPGLQDLLTQQTDSGRLRFSSNAADAIASSDVVFISVGTPPRASGEANLVAVEKAASEVARHATGKTVLAEKSTVPTGTAQRVRRTLIRERPDLEGDLEVVSNPEFLREGKAIEDSLQPDRILVGAESEWALEAMRAVYSPLIARGHRYIETDIATAELSKHACNAFLALKISFANALARLCERAGGDVVAVAEVMGADARIGPHFLEAGLGYGGSCFPKDLRAFERLAAGMGYDFPLLAEVARINDEAVEAAARKVEEALWNLDDKRVALLGLAFKPGTDDVRFAPALALARRLLDSGATVVAYDPRAQHDAKAEVPDLELAAGPYDAATGAHCVVVCTEWQEFRDLDLAKLKDVMAHPVIVDGRNIFDPNEMKLHGFSYYPTGRPAIH